MDITDTDEELLAAAKSGNLDAVKHCLQSGATKQNVALNISADQGHLPVVQHLLSDGRSQEEIDEALWYAAAVNHLPVVQYLVSEGANYRAKDNRAVVVAAEEDNLEVTQFFAQLGADIDIVESYGGPEVLKWIQR
ncbi:ankyrin repeat domain-containing protein [Allopusillimonas ginsengisoli]|uniref:ankyrin repeat domain-containing protein n=1 Tax=Allopusillimonas ginsengisoli TaxID=453575 RepID=UPI001485271B